MLVFGIIVALLGATMMPKTSMAAAATASG